VKPTNLRIAMVSLYLPSGSKIGSGYQAHYMANALVRRGHCVTMFSPCPPCNDALYQTVTMPVGQRLRTFRFAWNLRKIDLSPFDVLHAHGDDYWLWDADKPAHVRTMHGSCLAEARHVPGWNEKLRMLMLGLSEILATKVAHRTSCVSQNTRRYYPWADTVIMNGVDTSAFYPGDAKEESPTVLFVGTYQNRKRGKLLVDAFNETIRPAIPQAKLWMVCPDVPPTPGVEMLGRLSLPDLADRFRRAWVFCLPSSYEGFGVPYIEAMACGTPVVATPNLGACEVLADGKYGMIVEPADLGSAIVSLLNDPVRRGHLRDVGLQRARDFAWETIIPQYEALYASILEQRHRRAPTVAIS